MIRNDDSSQFNISVEEKKIMINLGHGIAVMVKNVRRAGVDLFDEIAAAIVAIKMYLKSKKNDGKLKLKSKNMLNSLSKDKNGRSVPLWIKTWLKEVMNEFDFNPYRHTNSLKHFPKIS